MSNKKSNKFFHTSPLPRTVLGSASRTESMRKPATNNRNLYPATSNLSSFLPYLPPPSPPLSLAFLLFLPLPLFPSETLPPSRLSLLPRLNHGERVSGAKRSESIRFCVVLSPGGVAPARHRTTTSTGQIHRCGRKGAHVARKCLWIDAIRPTTRRTPTKATCIHYRSKVFAALDRICIPPTNTKFPPVRCGFRPPSSRANRMISPGRRGILFPFNGWLIKLYGVRNCLRPFVVSWCEDIVYLYENCFNSFCGCCWYLSTRKFRGYFMHGG